MGQISLESEILSAIMKHIRTRYYCWYMVTPGFPIARTSPNAQGTFIVFYTGGGILTCKMYFDRYTKVIAKYEIANPKFDVSAIAKFIIAKLDEMRDLR